MIFYVHPKIWGNDPIWRAYFFKWVETTNYLVIQSALFWWLSDPFKWLSDLQLGDEKVTLNHLVVNIILIHFDFEVAKIDPEIWRKKMSPMLTHVFLSKKGGKKPGYQNTQVFGAGQDKDTS